MVESEGGVEHMKKDSINLFPTRRSTLLFHMRTNIIERTAERCSSNCRELYGTLAAHIFLLSAYPPLSSYWVPLSLVTTHHYDRYLTLLHFIS